jgi:uncharacterized protein
VTTTFEPTGIQWRSVSKKLIIAELLGSVFFYGAVIVAGVVARVFDWRFFGWEHGATAVIVVAAVLLLVSMFVTVRRVRAIGYQLRDDDFVVKRGIMWRRIVAVPYGRMQLVDITRGPLQRALGLCDLKLVTAAASSAVVVPGLSEPDAEALRDRLVELAESRRAGL